jgi:DNA-binding PadR family transcriptional regulator
MSKRGNSDLDFAVLSALEQRPLYGERCQARHRPLQNTQVRDAVQTSLGRKVNLTVLNNVLKRLVSAGLVAIVFVEDDSRPRYTRSR